MQLSHWEKLLLHEQTSQSLVRWKTKVDLVSLRSSGAGVKNKLHHSFEPRESVMLERIIHRPVDLESNERADSKLKAQMFRIIGGGKHKHLSLLS